MNKLLRWCGISVAVCVLASAVMVQPGSTVMAAKTVKWAVVLHGGAGVIERKSMSPEMDAAYRAGLKEALSQGASKAVGQLGASGGFLDNAKLKIPLPDSIRKVESGLRLAGMGKQADELVVSMNRAAEMAVKESTPILQDSVKKMSVEDAKGILTGGNDSATQYFRRSTSDQLTQRFNAWAAQ